MIYRRSDLIHQVVSKPSGHQRWPGNCGLFLAANRVLKLVHTKFQNARVSEFASLMSRQAQIAAVPY
jgi:hypothetical protein